MGRDDELAPLEAQAMLLLMDGMESTLLILQDFNSRGTFRVGGVPDTSSEAELVEALRTLERLGFVTATVEHHTQGGAHGNIPELREGRSEVTWWCLTREGRCYGDESVLPSRVDSHAIDSYRPTSPPVT